MNRKLGKQQPKYDERTLKLASYMHLQLPAPPMSVNYATRVAAWHMFKNDAIGDCTCAAAAHMIMAWTANAGKSVTFTDQQVVEAYQQVSGYNPTTGDNDNGAVELDVLRRWRRHHLLGHPIAAYAAVNPQHVTEVKTAANWFEGLYLGVALPNTAQDQTTWDVVGDGTTGDSAPGSWGGHAVNLIGYTPEHVTVVTWGQLLNMTWRFFARYVDESYALVSNDMLTQAGRCPVGLNLQTLLADLKKVTH